MLIKKLRSIFEHQEETTPHPYDSEIVSRIHVADILEEAAQTFFADLLAKKIFLEHFSAETLPDYTTREDLTNRSCQVLENMAQKGIIYGEEKITFRSRAELCSGLLMEMALQERKRHPIMGTELEEKWRECTKLADQVSETASIPSTNSATQQHTQETNESDKNKSLEQSMKDFATLTAKVSETAKGPSQPNTTDNNPDYTP